MAYMDWYKAVEIVTPHVVRITTPEVAGTGFLLSYSSSGKACTVATAAHVVSRASYWEQPIRIEHRGSGKVLLLRSDRRAIFLDEQKDTAGIFFEKEDLPLPEKPLDLTPAEKSLKVGIEIGWLGFPAVRNLSMK